MEIIDVFGIAITLILIITAIFLFIGGFFSSTLKYRRRIYWGKIVD